VKINDINTEEIQSIVEESLLQVMDFPTHFTLYPDSLRNIDEGLFISLIIRGHWFLFILSSDEIVKGFEGTSGSINNHLFMLCPENSQNIIALRKLFPFLKPSVIGKNKDTFGVGDRLGIASQGHLRVFKRYDSIPVLAQQSMRELSLTGRTFSDVIDASTWAVFRSGYEGLWAADGDHLKYEDDVIHAVSQGCTMITADVSDHINFNIEKMPEDEILKLFNQLDESYRKRISKIFNGIIKLASGITLNYNNENLARISLTYCDAITHAKTLYLAALRNSKELDFEISIDEIELPTTAEEHYFVAMELKKLGVDFSSLAPRFIGEFQKGIDYIGDVEQFRQCFQEHARIAQALSHKISIHSSSDKFSVYPIISEERCGAFHLKTSGTNWLIALETISFLDPEFFKKVYFYAYEVFETARAYYHVTPNMSLKSDISNIVDKELKKIFDNPTDRQVLHVSYGEVFKNLELKDHIFDLLRCNIEEYWDRLDSHIGYHLELLYG